MAVQSFDHLLKLFLTAEDHQQRITIVQNLAALKDTRAVQPLLDFLQASLDGAREHRCIGHHCHHLAQATELQWEIIAALGALGDQRAIHVLLQALEHRFLYSEAMRALGKLGGKQTLTSLIKNHPGLRVYSAVLEEYAAHDSAEVRAF